MKSDRWKLFKRMGEKIKNEWDCAERGGEKKGRVCSGSNYKEDHLKRSEDVHLSHPFILLFTIYFFRNRLSSKIPFIFYRLITIVAAVLK